jgi:hypothetical protein
MGGACGAYGGGERGSHGVLWGNLRERGRWGDPDVDGRIIFIKMDVQEVGGDRGDWMELAQDRDG